MHEEIIATIDIGSSKIIAAAGKKDEKGAIRILALETEPTKNSVRKGRIFSLEEVSNNIRTLLDRLNSELNEKIVKIYVGVGGQSLITTPVATEESESAVVDEQLLPPLQDTGETCHPDLLILGNPSIQRNLKICISDKNDIEIAGYFTAPVATAAATLTDQEKGSGCALIEFGAGITYLSVYKDNLLQYLVAIPIGGNVITKDICDLGVPENEAEDLKINALTNDIGENNSSLKTLNDIVEARVNEIIANIREQLKISGFLNALEGGIIITGGAAALKNLAKSIGEKINQKVRIASVREELIHPDSSKYMQYKGIEETIGLLSLGTENCIKPKEVENPFAPLTGTGNFDNSLFPEDEIEVKEKKTKKRTPTEKPDKSISKFLNRVSKSLFSDPDSTNESDKNDNV